MSLRDKYTENISIAGQADKKERLARKKLRRSKTENWPMWLRILIICFVIDSAIFAWIKYVEGIPVSEGLARWVENTRILLHGEKEEKEPPAPVRIVKNLPYKPVRYDPKPVKKVVPFIPPVQFQKKEFT